MQTPADLKRHAILYVDDEEKALKYFVRTFGDEFRFLTASNAAEGMQLIETHGDEIAVLITDQRMPGEKGVQLLERARQLRPNLVRILITAYADFDVTVDAVNLGRIFRYISKPVDVNDVRNTLHRAMEHHLLQAERDGLLREKLSVVQNVLITDRVMGLAVAAVAQSHLWRHPLRGLRGFLELAGGACAGAAQLDLARLRDPAFWRVLHDHVAAQCETMAGLLGGVPALNAPEGPLDAATLIREEFEKKDTPYAAKGIAVVAETEGQPPVVNASAPAFIHMLRLLMTAHASFLPSSTGMITATTRPQAEGAALRLALTCGAIPSGALRAVFDPFAGLDQAPDQGGLPLLGACLMAAHYSGTITQERAGQDLSLTLHLPCAASTVKAPVGESREFISRVLMSDALWESLLPDNGTQG